VKTRKFDTVSGSPAKLYRRRLARILKAERELHGVSRRKVHAALLRLVQERQSKGEPGWEKLSALVRDSLTEIEDRGSASSTIAVPDIRIFAEAYQMPGLLLDPARSEPVETVISSLTIKDFLAIEQKGIPQYGFRTQYRVPGRQLAGTENVAIVYLDMEGQQPQLCSSHSDAHEHPGEELLYVEDGIIEVRLEDSGLRCCLKRGSFIHFDSRSKHSASNLGSVPGRCFIIRFHQPQAVQRDEVTGPSRGWGFPRQRATATPRAKAPGPLIPQSQDSKKSREVIDRSGFGRFLQFLCSKVARRDETSLSLSELANRAKDEGYSFSRPKLDRIHHGLAPVCEDELVQLAMIYEIEPMVFYNFLLPTFKPAVAVHADDEMVKIDAPFLPPGVTYWLPPRRLAGSNMMITKLKIDPKSATKPNHHPGQELVKLLAGKVAIESGHSRVEIKKGGYAHFRSHFNHQAVNVGDEPATMLSIKFVGE